MPSILLFFYLIVSTLYLTRCVAIELAPKLYPTDGNVTSDESVTETQHATCKISTEELVASARATVTRVLTGACNAKTINEKFKNLENNLAKDLEEIKALLHALLQDGRYLSKQNEISNNERNIRFVGNSFNRMQDNVASLRQQEIDKLNGTVQETFTFNGTSSNFIYYWRIQNFEEKLANWKNTLAERSPTFYVGQTGYAMYIKVTLKYFPDETVFISVGLTRGRHDSFLKWPFSLKIRMEILDHSPEHLRQDRRSRIWDPSTLCSEYFWGRPKLIGGPDNPECVGLTVSRKVLFSKVPSSIDHSRNTRYLWNGAVTIKLTVYF